MGTSGMLWGNGEVFKMKKIEHKLGSCFVVRDILTLYVLNLVDVIGRVVLSKAPHQFTSTPILKMPCLNNQPSRAEHINNRCLCSGEFENESSRQGNGNRNKHSRRAEEKKSKRAKEQHVLRSRIWHRTAPAQYGTVRVRGPPDRRTGTGGGGAAFLFSRRDNDHHLHLHLCSQLY